MREFKLAGVIVLYHPDQNVLENIHSYLDDIEILFAVDNSETKNSEFIENLKKNPKIVYTDNNGNQGIAHALNNTKDRPCQINNERLIMKDFYD